MLMAKAPGSWSSFLAKVIGLGSRLWLYAQFTLTVIDNHNMIDEIRVYIIIR